MGPGNGFQLDFLFLISTNSLWMSLSSVRCRIGASVNKNAKLETNALEFVSDQALKFASDLTSPDQSGL